MIVITFLSYYAGFWILFLGLYYLIEFCIQRYRLVVSIYQRIDVLETKISQLQELNRKQAINAIAMAAEPTVWAAAPLAPPPPPPMNIRPIELVFQKPKQLVAEPEGPSMSDVLHELSLLKRRVDIYSSPRSSYLSKRVMRPHGIMGDLTQRFKQANNT